MYSATATSCSASMKPNPDQPTSTSSSPTSPASAPAIPSTRRSIVYPGRAGAQSSPAASPFPARPRAIPRHPLPRRQRRVARIVLYWYWAHDRGVASEYWAKYYLVKDSIRMNRSDGALVRITTLDPGETADAAQQRLLPFVGDLLESYIPAEDAPAQSRMLPP